MLLMRNFGNDLQNQLTAVIKQKTKKNNLNLLIYFQGEVNEEDYMADNMLFDWAITNIVIMWHKNNTYSYLDNHCPDN